MEASKIELYELAIANANEIIQQVHKPTPSQRTAIALFGLLLAQERLQGYKRTESDRELSDRVNSWIDPKLKFTGEV